MLIFLIFITVIITVTVVLYNRLVKSRNRMKEGWSGIDVQLKRRHSLVPSLVEIVKGYTQHEAQLLEDLTRLRTASEQADSPNDIGQKEDALSKGIKGVILLAEAYPDLKATKNFQQLSAQLVEIEDYLQKARRYYNGSVREYNIAVESFPSLVVANAFNFSPADYFEIEFATERANPEVELSHA